MREIDITDAIFNPIKKSPPKTDIENRVDVFYTVKGCHDEILDDYPINTYECDTTFAKKIGNRHFVKTYGSYPVDPFGLYGDDTSEKIGDEYAWKWTEVSIKMFELYTRYLKTMNKANYLQALREI